MSLAPHVPAARVLTGDKLAIAQGGYFASTGVWPVINLRSFETVTGPRVDGWLVQTVGAVLGVVGGVSSPPGSTSG